MVAQDKTAVWLAGYTVAIVITALLAASQTTAAACVAGVVLLMAGLFLARMRVQARETGGNRSPWLLGFLASSTVLGYGLTAGGVFSMGEEGSWYSDFAQETRWILYGGLGLMFVSDTLYMIDHQGDGSRASRTLRYVVAVILYVSAAINVHYLAQIARAAKHFGSLQRTLLVPPNASAVCLGKASSMNGTVSRIWPEVSAEPACVYMYWEHCRGNVLFAILFTILVLLIIEAQRLQNPPVLGARVASLISYAFQFAGYTSVVDDLDTVWHINATSCGLIVTHLGLGLLATVLRYRARRKRANQVAPQAELVRRRGSLNLDLGVYRRRRRRPVSP